jgi:steroid delta-isomerase-like uncharacterized protein
MAAEENKVVAHQILEVFNGHEDVNAFDKLLVADFVDHMAPPALQQGIDGYKGVVKMLRTAFPDLRYEVVDMIAEGDKLAARTSVSGTHKGEFVGIPPTGRRFSVEHIHWMRFVEGKAVEHWAVRDDLGQMQQLGVIPTAEHSEEASPT